MVTLILTEEEAQLLYDLLTKEAERNRISDPEYCEACDRIAQQLEPGGA